MAIFGKPSWEISKLWAIFVHIGKSLTKCNILDFIQGALKIFYFFAHSTETFTGSGG